MNQIYNFSKPFIIILIFTAVSCTPPAIIQDESQTEEFYQEVYYEEQLYESTELVLGADSVFQVWFSYEFKEGDFWVFYVHLVNYSVLSAQFDPAACYLDYEKRSLVLPDEPNLRVYAFNPEAELEMIAKEKEAAEERKTVGLGRNILAMVINIGVNMLDGNKGNDVEIFEDVIFHGGKIFNEIKESKMDSEFFEESEMFWKKEVLRKTIIQSGEEIGGLVYFPIQKRSSEFSAIVPFGGTYNLFEIELSK
jgi:hypothetical protein